MFRSLALMSMTCLLTAVPVPSAAADEASELCDTRFNRCTTVAEQAKDSCDEACNSEAACLAACTAEAEEAVKACDAAHDKCLAGGKS